MTDSPLQEVNNKAMDKPLKFRKKPVDVEAIQWTGKNLVEVLKFTGLHESALKWTFEEYEKVVNEEGFKVFTNEGPLMAKVGDYIVKGYTEKIGYHLWPVDPDYFNASYFQLTDHSTLH